MHSHKKTGHVVVHYLFGGLILILLTGSQRSRSEHDFLKSFYLLGSIMLRFYVLWCSEPVRSWSHVCKGLFEYEAVM